jgi:hypothetical protein
LLFDKPLKKIPLGILIVLNKLNINSVKETKIVTNNIKLISIQFPPPKPKKRSVCKRGINKTKIIE